MEQEKKCADLVMKTNISFGGFYHSQHSELIDHRIELYVNEMYIDSWEDINYKETYEDYIIDYCNELSEFILEEYEIDIDFKNLSLDSPRFYNFQTDTINCEIDKDKANELNAYFLQDQDFIQYLNERTKSYDGYFSFYTFEQAKNNKDNILIDYVLEYICKEIFNEVAELNDFELITKEEVA